MGQHYKHYRYYVISYYTIWTLHHIDKISSNNIWNCDNFQYKNGLIEKLFCVYEGIKNIKIMKNHRSIIGNVSYFRSYCVLVS